MKIIKYKKGRNGKYTVYLEDSSKINLYEETILEYSLLLFKKIDDLDEVLKYNLKYEVYYTALNSINSRFKSVSELRKFLINKEFDFDNIEYAVNMLIKQGYLNDRLFAKSFINNKIISTKWGPNKIKNELSNKGIDSNISDDELVCFTDEMQLEKIDKLITYMLKTNKSRSGSVLKSKIFNDLKMLGYYPNVINKIIDEYDYSCSSELYDKEYKKIYNRLSRKYSGSELEMKINEKLFQKGLYKEKGNY